MCVCLHGDMPFVLSELYHVSSVNNGLVSSHLAINLAVLDLVMSTQFSARSDRVASDYKYNFHINYLCF